MRAIATPAAALLEPGYRVDRYELLAKIGQGGMAMVWLARAETDAYFALKTILPEHAGDDELRKMMLDEARIAMGIDHPNVARTLEVGQLWDMPYLVLEYVAGESLDQLCQALASSKVTMPPAIAVRLVVDVCAGLHAAHELTGPDGTRLEIVHRDLSPHNILVDDHGIVKLIDFGIAKANARLTETKSGLTKGKIPYMAPEQALGGFVDRRADLWSLGAVLYVLLTGHAPFGGANDATRLMGKLSGDPPEPLPATLPEALRAVVDRTLSFYREERYATATELAEALEAAVPKATTDEVARFFAAQVGPAINARRHIVEHALTAASARSRARAVLSGQSTPPSFRRPSLRAPVATPEGDSEAPASTSIATGAPSRRAASRPWVAYVSVAAVAIAILLAYALGTSARFARDGDREGATSPLPEASPTTTTTTTTTTSLATASAPVAVPKARPSARPAPAATMPSARASASAARVPPARPVPSASASAKPPPEDTIF